MSLRLDLGSLSLSQQAAPAPEQPDQRIVFWSPARAQTEMLAEGDRLVQRAFQAVQQARTQANVERLREAQAALRAIRYFGPGANL